jgi:methyl-accepting chemotaxis protein
MTSLTELVASSSSTASAITQTASTVEEVKQTSQVAEQKAQTVSVTTQQTAHVTQLGEHAVETAITGLHHIHDQMESIAHSVISLGEQSRAIGEIITNVSELAEQSNLLAVNAAIEAARAFRGRVFKLPEAAREFHSER